MEKKYVALFESAHGQVAVVSVLEYLADGVVRFVGVPRGPRINGRGTYDFHQRADYLGKLEEILLVPVSA